MDFEKEVSRLNQMVGPEGCGISPEAQAITVAGLQEVDNRFGDNSEHHLEFHNALHSLDGIRRGIRLANLLHPFIAPKHQKNLFNLVSCVLSNHDIERGLGDGDEDNVRFSADYLVARVTESGCNSINNKPYHLRHVLVKEC